MEMHQKNDDSTEGRIQKYIIKRQGKFFSELEYEELNSNFPVSL